LGAEIARQPLEVRKRINQSMRAYGDRLIPYMTGRTVEEKRASISLLFSGMAGVMVAARGRTERQERERVLSDARSFYVKAFVPPKAA
jgi:hypothetical protein